MGASLLAIAECQSIEMLNVKPPSRAGSLPQGICGALAREITTLVLVFLSIVAFPMPRDWHVMGS
ncbi:hypothetical protein C1X35_12610 [Pseudomonas sp. FW306-1C-G01A]|nr:hypothetical protein C1X56_06250 [Pseudomonas sp. GW101-1A09]PMV92545.1 hypothetical protein C1X51_17940 [Pseudomonas sp. FW306-2-2C-B10A]PMV96220.1 hypothetical protein C1X55_19730 [Pseudomonas sp. GW460-C8]PMW04475.1 hypothetical protein C1X50_17420 [Pseudomonas sp. MPR-TSA4]PMW15262.1 hypothetical protein C1X52_13990 [Pseudomonas sp. FW306-2-1A-C05A]PMW15796.1 hypothetical protein C1X40_20180 [Pseudomonas sp. GW456-11-11-14-TSB2]PMW19232.1 hypothetical protein C1X53_20160 [Pseudomonas s